MKHIGPETRGAIARALFAVALLWDIAMPVLADGPGKPALEANASLPSLPFSMTFTKLPDKHIPDDVATYDSPLSTVVIDGEIWVINHDAWKYKGNPILRYKGTNFDDLVRQPDGAFDDKATNLQDDPQPHGDNYMLGGMWYDPKGKKLYAPLHTEYQNGPQISRRTRLATSTDKGMTWHFEGDIFTRDYPTAIRSGWQFSGSYCEGGPGDFCLYVDDRGGYFYLFAMDFIWPKTNLGGFDNGVFFGSQAIENHTSKDILYRFQVARCAIGDKMAPGKWHKFRNGTWSEPAIGGKGSYVPAYRVIYSTHLGKYIGTSWGSTMFLCSDLSKQDWTPKIVVPGDHWGAGTNGIPDCTYAWHLMNPDRKDVYTCDCSFLVYAYWTDNGEGRAYQVDLGLGKTTGLEYCECLSYYLFRHQQIPGLMYGYDPMPESADPIESRQTRIVGCDSPEMIYSGKWSEKSDPEYYGGVAKICGAAGASVELSFQGAEVYWRAVAAPDGGKADVFLDGKLQQTVDFYGFTTPDDSPKTPENYRKYYLSSLVSAGGGAKETVLLMPFFKTGLDPKTRHTVKIVVRGDKNPQSKGTLIKHMAFEYSAESYRASAGFCSVMGKNNWHYQRFIADKYGDLKFYGWRAANDKAPNNANLWCDVQKGSKFWDETCEVLPCAVTDKCVVGNNYQIADENDSVRKWVAPHDGKARIEGRAEIEKKGGAGMYVRILRNDSELWPSRLVKFGTLAAHDLTVEVGKGDAICFVVKRNGQNAGEKIFWDPAITYLP